MIDENNIALRDGSSPDIENLDEALLNFYNEDYIISGYNLQDQIVANVDFLIDKAYHSASSTEFAINTSEYFGAPCWHCATYKEGVDNNYYLIPIVDTRENLVNAVLFIPSQNSQFVNPVLVDRLGLQLDVFDPFDPIISDFDDLFSSKQWNFSNQEIQTRDGGRLPKIGCHDPCPNGHPIDKCRHPRDCDNTEIPGDDTAVTYIYIWTIIMSAPNPSDVITNFPKGGKEGGVGGPTGLGEPDGEFYATLVGELTEAIISLKDCISSLEDTKQILEMLNDQFPQLDFNENIDYTFNSFAGNLSSETPNASYADVASKAGQGVIAMSVASALANQDLATQLDVIDAINSMDCNKDTNGNNNNEEDEECLRNAISDFENEYEIALAEDEIEMLITDLECEGDMILHLIIRYLKNLYEKRNSPYNQANDCEKELMKEHPRCAKALAVNWIAANMWTNYFMGYKEHNGCPDAFRHSLFNALNYLYCGDEQLARDFGIAHECETDSELASIMDLHNNEIGYNVINEMIENQADILQLIIGSNTGSAWGVLIDNICDKLSSGEMQVFLDPDGQDPDNDPNNFLISSNDCKCSK